MTTTGELRAQGSRFDDVSELSPAGQSSRHDRLCLRRDAYARHPLSFTLDYTLATERRFEHRDEFRVNFHECARLPSLLFYLVDNPAPGFREVEVVGSLGRDIRHFRRHYAIHTIGTIAFRCAGDQIPDAVFVSEAKWVDKPVGAKPVPALILHAHLETTNHRCLQLVDERRSVPLRRSPLRRVDDHGFGGRLSIASEGVWERTDEFAQCGLGRRIEGSRRANQQEERSRFVRVKSAQVGAPTAEQRPTPTPAPLRINRDAGCRQRFEVTPSRRDGSLEFFRELRRRHSTARLHHQKGGDKPVRAHISIIPKKVLIR
jgi:hypothetical protein